MENLKKMNLVKPIERPVVGTVKKLNSIWYQVLKSVKIAAAKMNIILATSIKEIKTDYFLERKVFIRGSIILKRKSNKSQKD